MNGKIMGNRFIKYYGPIIEITRDVKEEHLHPGQGMGSSHQTGWTALVANLLKRRYELKDFS